MDGVNILVHPFAILFSKYTMKKSIPEQWSILKTIPVCKNKGEKDIKNSQSLLSSQNINKINTENNLRDPRFKQV
jgi:hypothetical protein